MRCTEIALLILVSSFAQAAELPPLLKEAEAKYSASPTLKAEFSQVEESVALGTKKRSSGTLELKRPGMIRWETTQPTNNLLISDGKRFWFYIAPFDESEPGKLVERKSSDVESRLATALLTGKFSAAGFKKIAEKEKTTFALTPKKGSAGTVNEVDVGIDPETKLIGEITLLHQGGNKMKITLSKVELGVELSNERFVFKAPPNTDKIDE